MISTKGRYALRIMLDLAQQNSEHHIPLDEIAARQEISEKYLESILKLLVKGKILTGLRGKGGGYRLNKAPEEYTVASILELTEETLAPVSCLEKDAVPCSRAEICRTLDMWKGLHRLVRDYFEHITLADLLKEQDS